jgi:hypothetical protein
MCGCNNSSKPDGTGNCEAEVFRSSASGAAIGATLGSLLGPIGTLIGAGLGASIGADSARNSDHCQPKKCRCD